MSATKNECNQGSPSIYRPEANAWISKRSSDLDYKGVFALIKIGFLQSSFYEVMWSSLHFHWLIDITCLSRNTRCYSQVFNHCDFSGHGRYFLKGSVHTILFYSIRVTI